MRPPRKLPPRPSPQEITRQCMERITIYQWGVIGQLKDHADGVMRRYDTLPPVERDYLKRNG